jgi:hypothetical protein
VLIHWFLFFHLIIDADKYSWSENYAGSSGLQSPLPGHKLPSLPVAVNVDQLEMDRIDQGVLVYCPLLDEPASYIPDMVDLTEDSEARYSTLVCAAIRWNQLFETFHVLGNIGSNVSKSLLTNLCRKPSRASLIQLTHLLVLKNSKKNTLVDCSTWNNIPGNAP